MSRVYLTSAGTSITGPPGSTGPAGPMGPSGPAGSSGPPGVDYQGVWSGGTTYAVNQWVQGSDGNYYFSLANGNTGNNPVGDGGVHWGFGLASPVAVAGEFAGVLTANAAQGASTSSYDRPLAYRPNMIIGVGVGLTTLDLVSVTSALGSSVLTHSTFKNPHNAGERAAILNTTWVPYWWFGLVGDGATDDAPALRAAGLASVKQSQLGIDGMGHTFGCASPVLFPPEMRRRNFRFLALNGFSPCDVDNAVVMTQGSAGSGQHYGPMTFTASGGTLTSSTATGMAVGNTLMLFGTTGLVGAVEGRCYYVASISGTAITLASTLAKANSHTSDVNITAGSGTMYGGLQDLGRLFVDDEYVNTASIAGLNGFRMHSQQPGFCNKLRVDNATGLSNPASAPTVNAGGAGTGTVADGTYSVAVTYLNRLGESKASAAASVTVNTGGANTGSIIVTSPPATTQNGTSKAQSYNIYVSAVGTTTPLFLQGSSTAILTNKTLTSVVASGTTTPTLRTCGAWGLYASGQQHRFANYESVGCDVSVLCEGAEMLDWAIRTDLEQFATHGFRTTASLFLPLVGMLNCHVTLHVEPGINQVVVDLTNIAQGPPQAQILLSAPWATVAGANPSGAVGAFILNPTGGGFVIVQPSGEFLQTQAGYLYINDPVNGSRDIWTDYKQFPPALIVWPTQGNSNTYQVRHIDAAGRATTQIGGLAMRRVSIGTNNATMLPGDGYFGIISTFSASKTLTLRPSGDYGTAAQLVIVKDEAGQLAGGRTLTITPQGADTIDGASTLVMNTAHQVVRLLSNASGWGVI